MTVYRLDPNPLRASDQAWMLSKVQEAVWTNATKPDEARKLVARKSARSTPAVWHPTRPQSPWLRPDLTSCVWEPSKMDIAPGAVMTLKGAIIGEQE